MEAVDLLEAVRRAAALHGMAKLKRQALELVGTDAKWLGDRATLEVHFGNALRSLWLAYQPIVSWRERRVFGYEALVRNAEPALGRPDDLAPLVVLLASDEGYPLTGMTLVRDIFMPRRSESD